MRSAAAGARSRSAWTKQRARPAAGVMDTCGAGLAAAMLALSAAAGMMAQNAADAADAEAARRADASIPAAASTPQPSATVVAAYGGVPYTYPSDFILQRPGVHDLTVRDVAWDGKPFKSPVYYGARVTRWPGDSLVGGMVDFTHSKAISRFEDMAEMSGTLGGAAAPGRARIGDVFRHLEFSHGHNMLTLNGLFRLPRIGARLLPYVGAGAGVSVPHTEIALRTDQKRTYEYQYAGPVGQALAGLEVRLPRASVFVEYKFTYAPYSVPLTQLDGYLAVTDLWGQFRRWLSGTPAAGGTARAQLTSHQVIAGLGVRLQAAAPAR